MWLSLRHLRVDGRSVHRPCSTTRLSFSVILPWGVVKIIALDGLFRWS
jgi:hypothetical protein